MVCSIRLDVKYVAILRQVIYCSVSYLYIYLFVVYLFSCFCLGLPLYLCHLFFSILRPILVTVDLVHCAQYLHLLLYLLIIFTFSEILYYTYNGLEFKEIFWSKKYAHISATSP